jgi:hypothetical protein
MAPKITNCREICNLDLQAGFGGAENIPFDSISRSDFPLQQYLFKRVDELMILGRTIQLQIVKAIKKHRPPG